MLEPTWSCGPILPTSVLDLLPKAIDEQEDQNELSDGGDLDIDWDDVSDDG